MSKDMLANKGKVGCRDLPPGPHRWPPLAVAVALLVLVGGIGPILLAWNFDALGIPRNDDWAYMLSAFHFADTGEINGYDWAGMNFVGQAVLSSPVVWLFGHRLAALQIEVAAVGVVGLIAVLDLARHVLSLRRALFVALMVAVGPMWGSLSASFMTDIPAFSLAMACLALGVRGTRRDPISGGLLFTSLALGFAAFTVREYAIVAPLAVGLSALWTAGRRHDPRRVVTALPLVGLVGLAALFFGWRRGLPGFLTVTPRSPSLESIKAAVHTAAQSAILVGLLVAPATLLAGPRRLVAAAWSRAPRTTLAFGLGTVVALLGQVVIGRRYSPQLLGPGNYVLPSGILGDGTLMGVRPSLLPRSLLIALAIVGVVSAGFLVCAAIPPTVDAVARIRGRRPLGASALPALSIVMLAALGFVAACTVPRIFSLPIFDRYVLPLVPLLGILVLHAGGSRASPGSAGRDRSAGIVAFAVVAALGMVYAANSASFDGTKWVVAQRATSAAGGPTRIAGSFEWASYHAGEPIRADRVRRSACVVLRGEAAAPVGGPGVVVVGRVWGPTGAQL